MYNKTHEVRFATLSHWLQRQKAQQIVPALLTAYGGVEAVEFIVLLKTGKKRAPVTQYKRRTRCG